MLLRKCLKNISQLKRPVMNKSHKSEYYKVGFISPHILNGIDRPPQPVCQQDITCRTKDFSMCRFPMTQYGARLYFDTIWDTTCNKCDRYLHKV